MTSDATDRDLCSRTCSDLALRCTQQTAYCRQFCRQLTVSIRDGVPMAARCDACHAAESLPSIEGYVQSRWQAKAGQLSLMTTPGGAQ